MVRDFNLFPETDKLLTLERKYGDSLNSEDLYGKVIKKKKKVVEDVNSQGPQSNPGSSPDLNATQQSANAGQSTAAFGGTTANQ